MKSKLKPLAFSLLFVFISLHAQAHDKVSDFSMLSGILHPLTGFDHFLAMFSVGMISSIMGSKNLWLVPASFVTAMLFGGISGVNNIAIPYAETGIAISIIALGFAIMFIKKGMKTLPVFCFVFLFGLFHGNAHGIEIPKVAVPAFYTTGFLLTTIFIHILGLFAGELATESKYKTAVLKITGGAVLFTGIYFLFRYFFFKPVEI